MTNKDKTPEELAEEAFNAIPLVDTIKKAAPKVHETSLFWFTAGYEAGYEAGRPKWVKTSEQLPERYKDVLCRCEDYYVVGSCVPEGIWTDPEAMDLVESKFREIVKEWQELPLTKED